MASVFLVRNLRMSALLFPVDTYACKLAVTAEHGRAVGRKKLRQIVF